MIENQKTLSQNISDFLDFLQDVQSGYAFVSEKLDEQNKLTQDYLHSIELDDLTYKARCKVATQLSFCRKERRYYKDKVEEYQHIIDFLNDPNNKKIINQLKQVLGSVRKSENYHSNRHYIPRVLKKEDK